ncbi:MAG: hypothetical protein M4579_003194 [Chaenotheca gracillima]|nr:MAG: hypothetical protein M4579_003194 [Chaenotheca gracillima]
MSSGADNQYEEQNDIVGGDVPGGDSADNDYASRTGQSQVPVQKDDAQVEDPIDADTADTDQQLARDDADAIDESNVVNERTRGAKPSGGYREPGDTEGIPS